MLDKIVAAFAASQPDRLAIAVEDQRWSYAQFHEAIEGCSAKLAASLDPRPALAVLYRLHPFDAWTAMIALRRAGVDTAATDDPAHLEEPFFASALVVTSRETLDGRRCVDLAQESSGQPLEATVGGAHHLASSGSTDGLKVLRMDPLAEPDVALARASLFGFDASTRFHIGGFGLWTAAGYKFPLAVWSSGGAVAIDRREDFADRIETLKINQAFLLPDQLDAWAARRKSEPIRELRVITSGGFTAAETVTTAARRVAGRLTNIYTSTEVNRTILMADYEGDPREFAWLAPAPGVEVDIIDESGAPANVGELRIRLVEGDCRSYAYGGSTGAFSDGWVYPGDLAERRPDGRLRLLGRADAMFIFGGQKLPAAPIETTVRERLGVNACVFSGQRRSGETSVVLVLETANPPDPAVVQAALTGLPKGQVVTVACVPEFPRTSLGMNKIRRNALRGSVFSKLDMDA